MDAGRSPSSKPGGPGQVKKRRLEALDRQFGKRPTPAPRTASGGGQRPSGVASRPAAEELAVPSTSAPVDALGAHYAISACLGVGGSLGVAPSPCTRAADASVLRSAASHISPWPVDERLYALLPASAVPESLAQALRLELAAAPDATAVERLLLRLFATSNHAFRSDFALASKVHDKTLLLQAPPKRIKPLAAAAAMRAAAAANLSLIHI